MTHPLIDMCSIDIADVREELDSLIRCTEFELRQAGYRPNRSYVAYAVSRLLSRYEPSEHTDALYEALESYKSALV